MMSNLDAGERKRLIEAAKDAMRDHFRDRIQQQTREQVER